MKSAFFWIPVLALVLGLSATQAAFAEPNHARKSVAAQPAVKPGTQRQNSGKPVHKPYVVMPKNGKTGLSGTEAKKSSSGINGTAVHRRH